MFPLVVGVGAREGTMPLPGLRRSAQHLPISDHFNHFLCAIGTPPTAALVFAYILNPCEPFKQWKSSSFFCCPNPHWFLQPEVIGVCVPGAGTVGCVVWLGAGITSSQGIPPSFYPPYMNVGLSIPPPPPPTLVHTSHCLFGPSPQLPLLPSSYPFGWMWLL